MNTSWDLMTPTEKRLAIVGDVIAQVKARHFRAEMQVYCRINDGNILHDGDTQLQKILEQNSCQVCAKGAIFAANILRNNNLVWRDYQASLINQVNEDRLGDLWTETEFDTIETAFEMCPINDSNPELVTRYEPYKPLDCFDEWEEWYEENGQWLTPLADRAAKFGYGYPNSEKRLLAIMENMLSNEGKFII
jgi:hypothetical protein